MARRYDVEPIKRALQHHMSTGAVVSFIPPGNEHSSQSGNNRWLVHVPGMGQIELTTAQTYALAVGLAAGERAHKPLDPLGTKGVP